MGYSFRLAARVLLYDRHILFHRQDSKYHGLWYTNCGAQTGMRNSSMCQPWRNRSDTLLHHEQILLQQSYISTPSHCWGQAYTKIIFTYLMMHLTHFLWMAILASKKICFRKKSNVEWYETDRGLARWLHLSANSALLLQNAFKISGQC